jgi:N-methylhydantoinase B
VRKRLPNAGQATIKSDEEWVAITSGGGGFGDPLERDPEAVREDVRNGFVSLKAAKEVYKVVLNTDPEIFEVDHIATKNLRMKARKEKRG